MTYELLFQPLPGGPPLDLGALEERLSVEKGPEGPCWRLSQGPLEVRSVREAGATVACSIHLPLSSTQERASEAVTQGCAVAEAAGLALCDPQLMRILSPVDGLLVFENLLKTARFSGELPWVSGAEELAPGALKPGTKVALAIVGMLFVAYWVLEAVLSR